MPAQEKEEDKKRLRKELFFTRLTIAFGSASTIMMVYGGVLWWTGQAVGLRRLSMQYILAVDFAGVFLLLALTCATLAGQLDD